MKRFRPSDAIVLALLSTACFDDDSPGGGGSGSETSSTSDGSTDSPTSEGTSATTGAVTTDGTDSAGTSPTSTTGSGDDVLPHGAIVPFRIGPCPPGWSEVTELRDRLLRGHDGDGTAAEEAGSATHGHTVADHIHVIAGANGAHTHDVVLGATNETVSKQAQGGYSIPGPNHTHTVKSTAAGGMHMHTIQASGDLATMVSSSLPPYREAIFCTPNEATDELPNGGMVLFETVCPPDWPEVMEYRDRFIIGHDADPDLPEDGGAATHSHSFPHDHGSPTSSAEPHTHTAMTGGGGGGAGYVAMSGVDVTTDAHNHTVTLAQTAHDHEIDASSSTAEVSLIPEYREVAVCEPGRGTSVPDSALFLFESACPAGFVEVMEYRNRYLRGHDGDFDYAEIGGASEHSHETAHDHGGETSPDAHTHTAMLSTNDAGAIYPSGNELVPKKGHIHPVSSSPLTDGGHVHQVGSTDPGPTDSQPNLPPFREIVVCKRG